MRKLKLFKSLLVVAMLLVGGVSSVWATDVPYKVGTEGTGDEWADRKYSDAYEIAPGETYHFTFTNTSYGTENQHNWLLDCKATADTSVDDWYFTMRSDNHGWSGINNDGYNSTMRYADFVWADFQTVMNGATVDMYVDYNSTDKIIRTYTTITKGETTWHYNFASKAINAERVFLLLSEELAVLNITTAEKVTGIPNGTYGVYKRSITNGYAYTWDTNTEGADYTGWTNSGGTKTLDLTDGLKLNLGNAGETMTTFVSPCIGNILNIEADFFLKGGTGSNASSPNAAYFRFGNIYILNDAQDCKSRYLLNGGFASGNIGTEFHSTSANSSSIYRTTGISYRVEMIINTATNILTSMKVYVNGSAEPSVNLSDQAMLTYDYTTLSLGFIKNRTNSSSIESLKNITITETPQSITTVDYTVKFQDALGNELKADVVHDNGVVGDVYQATAADMATFYDNADESLATKKYVYKSGQNTSVVASSTAAENVITLVFNEYTKYTATASAVSGGSSLQSNIASATMFTDETAYLRLPKYLKVGSTWYVTETSNVLKTATAAGNTEVEYTVSDIDYFFEETDFSLVGSFAATISKDFFSRGNGGRLYSYSYGTTETLEGGVYELVIAGAINTQTPKMTYGYKLGDADYVVLGESPSFNNGSYEATRTVRNVIIPDEARFCWINNTQYTSNLYIDYVTLTKIESYPTTIGEAGWATLYTPYALNFSGSGLTAYTATCDGTTVTLTPVSDVPANTGVVLKGAAGNYNIPVIASSATGKGDLEGSATEVTSHDVYQYDLYMLALNETTNKVQFTKATSGLIAAGKAYLLIAQTGGGDNARMLSVVFDDGDATGITNATAEIKAEDAIFNLAGQRVAQPANGLYIVNGKKVLVK